jgi:AGZA family xanthine/uracil permease-like MFS transporter
VDFVNRYFQLQARGTTVSRELRGALATFLTMAYILAVNPIILHNAGIDINAAVACTALASAICCILMGLYANFPLATAPGMGLNAFVAGTLALTAGSWQAAMGVIVLDGVVMLLLVQAGLREAVLNAIPKDLRLAIGAGIGLFIAVLGLEHGGFIVHPEHGAILGPGNLHNTHVAVALIGLVVMAWLMCLRVPGSILIGIIAATVAAYFMHLIDRPKWAAPSFSIAFQADIRGALHWSLVPSLFAVLMVDFFDTLGTATAVGDQAKLVDKEGRVIDVRKILIVDSLAATIGGMLGVSSVTAYIESAAGVAEGARTGLHSVAVGVLFLLAIFLAPLAAVVPAEATAGALILVGFLMLSQLVRIDLTKFHTAIPAFVTLIAIPMTYSIAHGIGYGFAMYVILSLLTGKIREIKPIMFIVVAAFVCFFVFEK